MDRKLKAHTADSTYPKDAISCFVNTFVQAESSVLRMKFSGKNPALRVAANRLTQAQLAEKCGTTKTYISRIENNASDIRLSTLMRIIQAGFWGQLKLSVNF